MGLAVSYTWLIGLIELQVSLGCAGDSTPGFILSGCGNGCGGGGKESTAFCLLLSPLAPLFSH